MGDHVKPHARWMERKDSIAAFEHMWGFQKFEARVWGGGGPDSEGYILCLFMFGSR